jgi:hypothetical protein
MLLAWTGTFVDADWGHHFFFQPNGLPRFPHNLKVPFALVETQDKILKPLVCFICLRQTTRSLLDPA